jgi:hypothetical protein
METTKKITKLSDDNYYSWSYEMELFLIGKGLWTHCQTEEELLAEKIEEIRHESEEAQSEAQLLVVAKKRLSASKDQDFYAKDKKCISCIGLNVDSKFYPIIRAHKMACDVWKALRANFTSHAGGMVLSLKTSFYKAEMEDGQESLNQYLDRIVLISEKLRELGCPTNEQEICYKVLSSLPDNYKAMTMALMVVDSKQLTISYLRSQFTLDSALLQSTPKGNALPVQPKKFEGKCWKCGQRNHKVQNCHAPEWIIERYQKSLKKNQEEQAKEATVMIMETETLNKASIFYLDSGCTRHMVSPSTPVMNRSKIDYQIYGAFGPPTRSTECGDVTFQGNLGPITLKSALIVPGMSKNLISIKAITAKGFEINFKGSGCEVYNSANELVLQASIEEKSGLYRIKTMKQEQNLVSLSQSNLEEWHQKLGHLSEASIKKLISKEMIRGIKIDSKDR